MRGPPSTSSQSSASTLQPSENVKRFLATLGSPDTREHFISAKVASPLKASDHLRKSEGHVHVSNKQNDLPSASDTGNFSKGSDCTDRLRLVSRYTYEGLFPSTGSRLNDFSSNDKAEDALEHVEQTSTFDKEMSSGNIDSEDSETAIESLSSSISDDSSLDDEDEDGLGHVEQTSTCDEETSSQDSDSEDGEVAIESLSSSTWDRLTESSIHDEDEDALGHAEQTSASGDEEMSLGNSISENGEAATEYDSETQVKQYVLLAQIWG